MNVGQITLGQPIQVEAFAKVEGQDTSKAEVQAMRFSIFEGNPSAGRVRRIEDTDPPLPVTIVEDTANLVRYRAEWTASPTLKLGEEYRIMAVPKCVVKTAGIFNQPAKTAVLAESDERVGFFGQVINFFAGLFGTGKETNEGVQLEEERQGPLDFITNFFRPQTTQRDQLQLDTFYPAQMEKEACNIVKFKFDFVSP